MPAHRTPTTHSNGRSSPTSSPSPQKAKPLLSQPATPLSVRVILPENLLHRHQPELRGLGKCDARKVLQGLIRTAVNDIAPVKKPLPSDVEPFETGHKGPGHWFIQVQACIEGKHYLDIGRYFARVR